MLAFPDDPSQSDVVVKQGRYGLRQLREWRHEFARSGADPSTILLIDIDERINKVFIGVSDDRAAEATRNAMGKHGVPPTRSLLRWFRGPRFQTEPTLSDTVNPIMDGVASANCTVGFNVEYNDVMYFATNSHCSENNGVVDNKVFH